MRYAIVSDLHANARAWDAVLADLCEQEADLVVCLGDIVGYGPNPTEVLESVRCVTENLVMGNHDAAAAGLMDYSIFNDQARQAIEWTMTVLGPEAKQALSSMPLAIDAGEILFVHAEIAVPGRFGYISDTRMARENFAASDHFVTFVGHTHVPTIFEQNARGKVRELPDEDIRLDEGKRFIVNVGSVGEPRDFGDLRARYVLYDDATRVVTFRRVEFDIAAYRHDLEATTLALRPFFLRVYEQAVEGGPQITSEADNLIDMQVGHQAEALVDSGQVAKLSPLGKSGRLLERARSRRLPILILATAAALALSLGFYHLFLRSESPPSSKRLVIDSHAAPPPPPADSPLPVERQSDPAISSPNPISSTSPGDVAENPSRQAEVPEQETRSSDPVSADLMSADLEQEAEPRQDDSSQLIERVWWRMGTESLPPGRLRDTQGQLHLATIQEGRVIKNLAPDPVPATGTPNPAGLQLGIWQEENPGDHFALTVGHSFTLEGWFLVTPFRTPVFLFGTRTGKSDGRGWHLDLRPGKRARQGESIAFFYDSGEVSTQAIAENRLIADGEAHHVAVVWDHDFSAEMGQMAVFLDGIRVAARGLPHARISGRQAHPFRIGARFNPRKLGLDEVRFTRRSLRPHQFLLRAPVTGATMIQSDGRVTDSWTEAANWQDGKMPQPSGDIVIGAGVKAQLKSRPTPSAGSLVLQQGAELHLWTPESEIVIPTGEERLIMHADASLVLHSDQETKMGPVELLGQAHIFGGASTADHHRRRRFVSPISGSGALNLHGVHGNTFSFEGANRFTGGLITHSINSGSFQVVCAAERCLGEGGVHLRERASLKIEEDLESVISDEAALILTGPSGSLKTKLVLESDEQVGRFVIDGADQGEGIFSQSTHPEIISGEGQLIVRNPSE